jgi:hypothetical protein
MPRPIVLCMLTFASAAVGLTRPALAQSDQEQRSAGYNAILDNIDLLVDNYTRFLARKYDLTEEQDEYTKYLLRERAQEFLNQHDDRLRVLVDRLFEVRTGGDMTQEELIQWGQQVQPIYEEAKQLIIDGNNEWREILTDEQKAIHDGDVKLMYQSFETTEEKLGRILSGEMTVEEFRSPQRARRSSPRSRSPAAAEEPTVSEEEPVVVEPAEPLPPPTARKLTRRQPAPIVGNAEPRVTRPEPTERPARQQTTLRRLDHARPEPDPRATTGGPAPAGHQPANAASQKPESEWEKYVREFIEKYKLNDEQSQKAHAVLEDCQAQRDRYLRGRAEQLEKLDLQVEELKKSNDKNKSNNLTQLADKRKALMAPIDEIFTQQLKPRLERLPTRAQRRAAEAAAKKPASKETPEKRTPPAQKTSVRTTTVKKGKQPAEPKDD